MKSILSSIVELNNEITADVSTNKVFQTSVNDKTMCVKKYAIFISSNARDLNRNNKLIGFNKTVNSVIYTENGTLLIDHDYIDNSTELVDLFLEIKDKNIQIDLMNCKKFNITFSDIKKCLEKIKKDIQKQTNLAKMMLDSGT